MKSGPLAMTVLLSRPISPTRKRLRPPPMSATFATTSLTPLRRASTTQSGRPKSPGTTDSDAVSNSMSVDTEAICAAPATRVTGTSTAKPAVPATTPMFTCGPEQPVAVGRRGRRHAGRGAGCSTAARVLSAPACSSARGVGGDGGVRRRPGVLVGALVLVGAVVAVLVGAVVAVAVVGAVAVSVRVGTIPVVSVGAGVLVRVAAAVLVRVATCGVGAGRRRRRGRPSVFTADGVALAAVWSTSAAASPARWPATSRPAR